MSGDSTGDLVSLKQACGLVNAGVDDLNECTPAAWSDGIAASKADEYCKFFAVCVEQRRETRDLWIGGGIGFGLAIAIVLLLIFLLIKCLCCNRKTDFSQGCSFGCCSCNIHIAKSEQPKPADQTTDSIDDTAVEIVQETTEDRPAQDEPDTPEDQVYPALESADQDTNPEEVIEHKSISEVEDENKIKSN